MKYLICMQRTLNGITTTYYLTKINDINTYELLNRARNTNSKYPLEEARSLIPIAKKIMRKNTRSNYKLAKRFNEHHYTNYSTKWNIFLLRESKLDSYLNKLKDLRQKELNNQ